MPVQAVGVSGVARKRAGYATARIQLGRVMGVKARSVVVQIHARRHVVFATGQLGVVLTLMTVAVNAQLKMDPARAWEVSLDSALYPSRRFRSPG